MPRTLIGQLVLKAQDDASGVLKKAAANVSAAFNKIDADQKRLAKSAQFFDKKSSWGVGFQKQLDTLKLTSVEMARVRQSYTGLVNSMKAKGLGKALQSQEISAWRVANVSHFAAIRAEMASTERRAKQHARFMHQAMRPFVGAGGAVAGGYVGGIAARAALTAGAQEQAANSNARIAGLSVVERQKIGAKAAAMSTKYRLSQGELTQLYSEASLSMPSTDAAMAVGENMAKAYKMLAGMFDPAHAMSGLRAFNKAMDNVEKITPQEYNYGLENYMKAQQVIGKDIDPQAFAQAIKFSRTSGKVFGDEFLFKYMPALIAETGGADTGTQLRAFYDQFVTGRASKAALAEQGKYGLRDKSGKVIDQELFGLNPLKWIDEVLMPRLEKAGVDMSDNVELGRIVGKLTNNRLSADQIMRVLLSVEQYERIVKRMDSAQGLDAAATVDFDNAFSAFASLKTAAGNLSAALLPMDKISKGLTFFADQINWLKDKARENPDLATGAGVLAGAGGAYGAYKATAAVYGLITAGTSLKAAAAALTRAAVLQGGGDVTDLLDGGKNKGGVLKKILSLLPPALLIGAGIEGENIGKEQWQKTINGSRYRETSDNQREKAMRWDDYKGPPSVADNPELAGIYQQMFRNNGERSHPYANARQGGTGGVPTPSPRPAPAIPTPRPDFSNAEQAANDAGRKMQEALSIVATPTVQTGQLQHTLNLVNQIKAGLREISGMAANVSQPYTDAMGGVYSDYGVTP